MKKQKLTTRQKESQKITRKRAVRQWWRITTRRCIIIMVIVGAFTLAPCIWWFNHSGTSAWISETMSNYFWQHTADAGFKVETIYLEGRQYTDLNEISSQVQIKTGSPILRLNLSEVRSRLEAIPRIKYADVERILPNQIHIRITEREPIALWQNEGKLHLIDADGIAMDYVDPAKYQHLMLVVGENAPAHTSELLLMLSHEPEIFKNVAAVLRIGERRWNIRFKNGIELKLPEKNSEVAWHNFALMQNENHILERAIQSIDMRIYDRIFIKTTPAVKQPDKDSGSDT